MRLKFLNILFVVAAALTIVQCGSMQKVLKSGDHQLIYDEGLRYYEAEDWSRATTLLTSVQHLYSGTEREDSIDYFIARSKAKSGDYYGAIESITEFRREFGRSVFIEDAEAMYAMCYYYLSPQAERDQTTTQQALSAIYEFMARYPDSDKNENFEGIVDELQSRLHEKSYLNAYTYYKIGRYKSAIIAFRNALKEYPESEYREELLYHVVASSYELAKNSILSKQEDRYLALLDSYYTFVSEFPESEHMRSADRMAKAAKNYLAKTDPEALK